jgi:hypothetical protein
VKLSERVGAIEEKAEALKGLERNNIVQPDELDLKMKDVEKTIDIRI